MLMNKTEMRMLRWIKGVSVREHKRNEDIGEAATVQPITTHIVAFFKYCWRSNGRTYILNFVWQNVRI